MTTTIDREAVIELAALYSYRLGLHTLGGDDYAECKLGRVAIGAAGGDPNLKIIDPQLIVHDTLICGIDIALAVLADPLVDPSAALKAAFDRYTAEIAINAKSAREDIARGLS